MLPQNNNTNALNVALQQYQLQQAAALGDLKPAAVVTNNTTSNNSAAPLVPPAVPQDIATANNTTNGLMSSVSIVSENSSSFGGAANSNSNSANGLGVPNCNAGTNNSDGSQAGMLGNTTNSSSGQHRLSRNDISGVDPSYPMTDIEYPGQNDCMFGRGGGTSNHIG